MRQFVMVPAVDGRNLAPPCLSETPLFAAFYFFSGPMWCKIVSIPEKNFHRGLGVDFILSSGLEFRV